MRPAIHDSLLPPLGMVVVNFNLLDNNLSFGIWHYLFGASSGEQRTGQIVTAELRFKDKIALFSSLYQHRFPEKSPFDELKGIRAKLTEANKKRNSLIHSVWAVSKATNSNTRIATTAKESRGIKFEFEKMSAKDIEEIADFISTVSDEVFTFVFE